VADLASTPPEAGRDGEIDQNLISGFIAAPRSLPRGAGAFIMPGMERGRPQKMDMLLRTGSARRGRAEAGSGGPPNPPPPPQPRIPIRGSVVAGYAPPWGRGRNPTRVRGRPSSLPGRVRFGRRQRRWSRIVPEDFMGPSRRDMMKVFRPIYHGRKGATRGVTLNPPSRTTIPRRPISRPGPPPRHQPAALTSPLSGSRRCARRGDGPASRGRHATFLAIGTTGLRAEGRPGAQDQPEQPEAGTTIRAGSQIK